MLADVRDLPGLRASGMRIGARLTSSGSGTTHRKSSGRASTSGARQVEDQRSGCKGTRRLGDLPEFDDWAGDIMSKLEERRLERGRRAKRLAVRDGSVMADT